MNKELAQIEAEFSVFTDDDFANMSEAELSALLLKSQLARTRIDRSERGR